MLYSDRGRTPYKLVTFTSPFALVLGAQTVPPAAPIEIEAGPYWLASVFERHASLGIDYSDKGAIVKWATHAFGAPPDFFPTPNQFTGQQFNWWVSLQ